jgi:conjugal transfer pilus assembly protein TraB
MGQGAAFYPGGSGQRMTGGLSTNKVQLRQPEEKANKTALDSVRLLL